MGIKNILIITIVLTFSCFASDFNYKEYETSWGHFYDLFPLFITTEEIDNVAKSKIMNSNILALISYKAWKDIREIGTHPKKEKWWLDRYCLTINPDRFNPKIFYLRNSLKSLS